MKSGNQKVIVSHRFSSVPLRERLGAKPYKPVRLDFSKDIPLTQQSGLVDADINNILRKFKITGLRPIDQRQAIYGDFTKARDYIESLNLISQADDVFMELPADIRQRFSNSPIEFCKFAEDPKNKQQMIDWGLYPKKDDDAVRSGANDSVKNASSAAEASKPLK